MSVISIGQPLGSGRSSCGYCRAPRESLSAEETSFKKAGFLAIQLSCNVYQRMIDRGWRRSGTYCYAPDLKHSCCPQYTIKLDTLGFEPSRSQRKVLHRWNRYVLQELDSPQEPKKSKSHPFDLISAIHAPESAFTTLEKATHKFEIELEMASYTEEKYDLFERYQIEIHDDVESEPSGFTRFLVDSPLIPEDIPYVDPSNVPSHLPRKYGSYHQLYRLDGHLIAVGVIDILPYCVSSVYFFYNPNWEKHSLGKLSALREASLAQEIHAAGAPAMSSLYMGYYIHACQKMRYKGEFSPSYLADPETFTWHKFSSCTSQLDQYRYAVFSHPDHSLEGTPNPDKQPVAEMSITDIEAVKVARSMKQGKISVIPANMSDFWEKETTRMKFTDCLRALGDELSKEIIFC